MNPIGKIRIKSIGQLLPTNRLSTSNENLQTINENVEAFNYNTENDSNISLSPTSLKVESIISEPTISFACVDLTEDTFETPVRKNTAKETNAQNNKSQKRSKSKPNSAKPQVKQKIGSSSAAKSMNEDVLQTKLLSFFTPSSTVKRAPKKLGKPPEQDLDNNLPLAATPPRKLRKLSLRRNILSSNNEQNSVKKPKKDIERDTPKPKINLRSKKKLNTLREEKLENFSEVEKVAEPTMIPGVIDLCDCESDEDIKPLDPPKRPATVKSEKSICPSYKVVEGTTFAVDGFKFGRIEGVTAYFLSHYHADHYIGLTRKFSMPLYVSQITANLMREFIPVDEKYINVLPINITTEVEGVQVTAIDANHCPGAVMFLFQLPCGKRILHTGDFRASIEMESNPYLSQRNIDLLYLDTTYISHNYSFQTQEQSIADGLKFVREFKERNEGKRILFAVGTYLVGKEKFWLPIAKEFDFKIWTDSNRRKIMHAINDEEILQRLVTKSRDADMHIIPMMKVGYRGIEAYWEDHCDAYDMIFAIRPSGWEKNSKPQFRGQLNIVGIEYSEHSSHNELRRFLSFLRPQQVISTVPYGKDLTKCPDVPLSWYKKECFSPIKKQASLLKYFKCPKTENKIS
ncbi:uncharacterized protein LOC129951869 [Eupeodes corollae]|uniref:uncharacterized protein LOC129951869 n=1 Tax=Eupeodes corollae TaxID=290404 RepID=UPI002490F023|nr:uncharacterized protein LOC129951869 [Eupeodes corollae]XP_055920194.1 uncharacterized protein LOC129951869 [Eupeodes corollae]